MIQDVDETLRRLVVSELSKVPDSLVSDGSQITFDPPTAAEASDGPRCRLNLYLHDVRENVQLRDQSWAVVRRSEEGSIRLSLIHI